MASEAQLHRKIFAMNIDLRSQEVVEISVCMWGKELGSKLEAFSSRTHGM